MDTLTSVTMDFPDIETLIPHEGKMVLIDEIVTWSEDEIHCRRTIRSDAFFVEDDQMPATLSLEYMAQSIAAYAGYMGHLEGDDVELAFLLSCRDLELFAPCFDVGDVIDVFASPTWIGETSLGSFRCSAMREGETVAKAQLNVYQGPLDSVARRVS